jgi:hypothetical protein
MQQVKEDSYLVNFNQLGNYLFFSTIESATKERTNSRQSIHGETVDIWICASGTCTNSNNFASNTNNT